MEKQGYLSKKRNPSKNKVVLIILSIFIFVVSLFLAWKIELYLYRPLSDKDFSNLFPHYTSVRKISSQDVLIESIHGEIYELHTFLVENASVNEQYPLTESKWENLKIVTEPITQQWTKEVLIIDRFNELADSRIKRIFAEYWNDSSVYHCYIISQNVSYWFSYCPIDKKLLYLIYKI